MRWRKGCAVKDRGIKRVDWEMKGREDIRWFGEIEGSLATLLL